MSAILQARPCKTLEHDVPSKKCEPLTYMLQRLTLTYLANRLFYRRTRHNTCARRTLQNVFIIDVPGAVPVLDVLCKMSLSSTYPAQRPCLTYLAKCLYYRRTRHNACVWHTLQNVCINTTCELDVSCQMS